MTRPSAATLVAAATVAAAGVLLLGAAPAWAHLAPTLQAIPAGRSTTVGFTLEHGCEGSPTTELAFKVPDGIDAAHPVAEPGWTASQSGDVITFTAHDGQEQPADEAALFELGLTPSLEAVGETLLFKALQTCEEGEIRWIEVPEDGVEPDHPAPAIEVEAPDEPPVTAPPDEGGGDDDTATPPPAGGGGGTGGGQGGGQGGGGQQGGPSQGAGTGGTTSTTEADTTTTVELSPDTTDVDEVAVGAADPEDEEAATELSGSATADEEASVALILLVLAAIGFAGVAIHQHRKGR